jgi:hypothetical protein
MSGVAAAPPPFHLLDPQETITSSAQPTTKNTSKVLTRRTFLGRSALALLLTQMGGEPQHNTAPSPLPSHTLALTVTTTPPQALSSVEVGQSMMNRMVAIGKDKVPAGVFLDPRHVRLHVGGQDYHVLTFTDPWGRTYSINASDVQNGAAHATVCREHGGVRGAAPLVDGIHAQASLSDGTLKQAVENLRLGSEGGLTWNQDGTCTLEVNVDSLSLDAFGFKVATCTNRTCAMQLFPVPKKEVLLAQQ